MQLLGWYPNEFKELINGTYPLRRTVAKKLRNTLVEVMMNKLKKQGDSYGGLGN